jgi:hypothetical protein
MAVSPRLPLLLPPLVALLWTSPAAADDTERCVDAYVETQKLQRAGKLVAARAALIVCADAKCPDAVRTDCLQWMAWNEAALPSILLQPVLPEGASPASLRVEIDGSPMATPPAGHPILLDPGLHRVRLSLPGAEPSEQQISLRPGEKARRVTIALRVAQPEETSSAGPSDQAVGAYTLWGIGGAGVLAFAVLGLVGRSEIDDLSASCAPNCTEDQVDKAWNKLIAADVCGAVGLVSLVVGTVLYAALPDEAERELARLPLRYLAVRPTVGGGVFETAISF